MAPTHDQVKSLSGTVFRSMLVFALVAVAVFGIFAAVLLYNSYERDAESNLAADASGMAQALDSLDSQQAVDTLDAQLRTSTRVTLIAQDGAVSFDSIYGTDLPNHADRPEFQAAESDGQAALSRYSDTLKTDTLYAAVRLSDGSTLRLAETRHSLASFLISVAFPLIFLVAAVVVAALFASRALTRRIMQPIDALDFKHPLKNEIYQEMDPLLVRIDDQQKMLIEQNRELALADDMRREFSANVSHEMKTPLTVISGYAELLKDNLVKKEDRLKFAGLIYDEAQNMRALIDDVLTISRLEEESDATRDDAEVDVLAVTRTACRRLESYADSAQVTVEVGGAGATVLGGELLCEQMMHNLVENGIRYNHPGGEVHVEVGTDEEGRARISVSDNGQGIPAASLDKVFERFYRVDKSRSKERGGTGLGLAIVKHAVQYQGGTIEVHSKEGEGTQFVLFFPTVEARRAMLARHRPAD